MSPAARTLALLRKEGWQVAVVEKWLPHVHLRQDLWHFGDVLACHPKEKKFLVVQVTTVAHVAHRLAKAQARVELAVWLEAGGCFEVWGWALRNGRWHCKRVKVLAQSETPITEVPKQQRRSRWKQGTLWTLTEKTK